MEVTVSVSFHLPEVPRESLAQAPWPQGSLVSWELGQGPLGRRCVHSAISTSVCFHCSVQKAGRPRRCQAMQAGEMAEWGDVGSSRNPTLEIASLFLGVF